MQIGFITTMAATPWGGSEEIWVDMAGKISDYHQVGVSFYDWGNLHPKIAELKAKGVQLHLRKRIAYTDLPGRIKGKLRQVFVSQKELESFTQKGNHDHLIISMGSFADLEIDPFRKFLMKTSTNYVLIVHVNPMSYRVDRMKLAEIVAVCKKADKVLFVSNKLWNTAKKQTKHDFSNGGIISNPINMTETGVLPLPTGECLEMAIVGRILTNAKGHDLLIQLLAQPQWKHRDWKLNIYGEGEDRKAMGALVNQYELSDKIIFQGNVNDIRNDIWKTNHLLLMPSHYEGMPLALIEAMLCGRTAVVSDVGGATELMEDNVHGFIAKDNSVSHFGEALERAWRIKGNWSEMGEKGYVAAQNHFHKYSPENVFPDFFK